jgi:hypothetical protein
MTTSSIGVLYFARLLIGVSNGLFNTFGQLYIQVCFEVLSFSWWLGCGADDKW